METSAKDALWETFVRRPADLRVGVRVPLVLRDLRPGRSKYGVRHVIGIVHEGGGPYEKLSVRTVVGVVVPKSYGVEILEDLPSEVRGQPYRDFYQALAKVAQHRAVP